MAKQSLSNTAPATTLPAGATIINDNFTELYNILGGSTLPTLSAGAVAFAASGAWSQDATNFLYTTGKLTIGTTSTTVTGAAATGTILSLAQERNNGATVFDGAIKVTIKDTASAAGSLAFQILGGAAGTTVLFAVDKNGAHQSADGSAAAPAIHGTNTVNSGIYFSGASPAVSVSGSLVGYFSSYGYIAQSNAIGFGNAVSISSPTNNSVMFNGTNSSAATTTARTCINKAVTAFTDGVAKATFTVTVPNAAHSASIRFKANASIGAGGAIGANEASATIQYDFSISRTAGVNAVMVASTAYGSAASAVAGATTCTVTAAASAVSGAVGATNTFTINVTITKGGGSSDNHTCTCFAELLNANASGVTIA